MMLIHRAKNGKLDLFSTTLCPQNKNEGTDSRVAWRPPLLAFLVHTADDGRGLCYFWYCGKRNPSSTELLCWWSDWFGTADLFSHGQCLSRSSLCLDQHSHLLCWLPRIRTTLYRAVPLWHVDLLASTRVGAYSPWNKWPSGEKTGKALSYDMFVCLFVYKMNLAKR